MVFANSLFGFLAGAFVAFPGFSPNIQLYSSVPQNALVEAATHEEAQVPDVPEVPFYSQFYDISAPEWRKKGCGIASLAMIIELYKPGAVSVDALLREGIAAGAYAEGAGWKHLELALLARPYGLQGGSYDVSRADADTAFVEIKKALAEGPVIASVYYEFDPESPIPHLAVINGIRGDTVYYNDPAAGAGNKTISTDMFKKGWKKRFIAVHL